MKTFIKIRDKFRHGLVLEWLIDRLKLIGIEVKPLYLILERAEWAGGCAIPSQLPKGTAGLLTREEVAALGNVDGRAESAEELMSRIDSGGLCHAFRTEDGTIAAFSWADLVKGDGAFLELGLGPGEAYLYDMHTLKAFRGKNIALHLRACVYDSLARLGRTQLYSLSSCFNRPSIRFKEKLGGRVVKTFIHVKIRKFKWNFMIRDHSGRPFKDMPLCKA